jgi:ankyrin repeat protein
LFASVSLPGYAPLHEAAICGHIEVVKLLVESGADVDVQTDVGYTALHLYSDKLVAEYLIVEVSRGC